MFMKKSTCQSVCMLNYNHDSLVYLETYVLAHATR